MSDLLTEQQPQQSLVSPEMSEYALAVRRLIDSSTFESMRTLLGEPDEHNRFTKDALAARCEERRELFDDISSAVQGLGAAMLSEQGPSQTI